MAFKQASRIILSDHILNQGEYLGGELQRPTSGIPLWKKPCFVLHSDGNSLEVTAQLMVCFCPYGRDL